MNKKLMIVSVACVIALLLGGFNNTILYGIQYLTSRPGYSYVVGEAVDWWDCEWSYSKKITIDHTKIASDQFHYPVLLHQRSDADLALYAQSNGGDIVFVDNFNSTQYAHELELFNSVNGEMIAWVNIPSLSSSADTVLYMYYGNAECGPQWNSTATWNSGYVMVHHLQETSGHVYDSTGSGIDGTVSGSMSLDAVGKIGSGASFEGLEGHISFGSHTSLNITGALTVEAWVKDPPIHQVGLNPPSNEIQSRSGEVFLGGVEILDKKTEQKKVSPGEVFHIQRTVVSKNNAEIVFAVLCSPGVSVVDILVDSVSVYDMWYTAFQAYTKQEKTIEEIRMNLSDSIADLTTIYYTHPFTGCLQGVVVTVVASIAQDHVLVDSGRMSYLVMDSDGGYDVEFTTHWTKKATVASRWFNPYYFSSFFKNIFSRFFDKDDADTAHAHVSSFTYERLNASFKDKGSERVLLRIPQGYDYSKITQNTDFKVEKFIESHSFIAGEINKELFEKLQRTQGIEEILVDVPFTLLLNESLGVIRFPESKQNFNLTGKGIRIGLLDTGVDPSIVPYTIGYDFVNKDDDAFDDHGHGTQMASIIHEIASDAELIVAKVIDSSGKGYMSDVLAGLLWCLEQQVDIISFSIGSTGRCGGFCDDDLVSMVCEQAVQSGVFVVASAGNDGSKLLVSPACSRLVFSVGATDNNDSIAGFSNVNPTLDMFAPGVDIITCAGAGSGTSYSSPFVAGVAALLFEKESFSVPEIKQRLQKTGIPISYVYSSLLQLDIPRLDVFNAVHNISVMEPYDYSNWWSCSPGGWVDEEFGILSTAPTVATNHTTGVTSSNATLHGYLIDDGGEQCTVRFEYGTTIAYGTNTSNLVMTQDKIFQYKDTDTSNAYSVWGDDDYIFVAAGTDGLIAYSFDNEMLSILDTQKDDGSYYDVWGDGEYVYVAAGDVGIYSYTFDGNSIEYKDIQHSDGDYYGIWGDGDFIFVARGSEGIAAYESIDGSPNFLDAMSDGGIYYSVWGDGTYIYAACGLDGIRAYSFDGTRLSVEATRYDGVTEEEYVDVWGDGTYIYAAQGSFGVRAYSFDGNSFSLLDTQVDGGVYSGVFANSTHVFTACGAQGVRAYSFNGSDFTLRNSSNDGSAAHGVWGRGSSVFVADTSDGLLAYRFDKQKAFSINIPAFGWLLPGRVYHYRAFANNTRGSDTGDDKVFLTKPLPPQDFTAQTNDSSTIYLSWSSEVVTGANTTRIQRKSGSYPTSISDGVNVYNGTGFQIEDTGLDADTTYFYRAWSFTTWTVNPTLSQWSDLNASSQNITNMKPLISDAAPVSGSSGVDLIPLMNITVADPDGDSMTIIWYSNSSGDWHEFGRNESIGNGTYHQVNTNFSEYGETYYWYVTVSDGLDTNTSDVFYFTTSSIILPQTPTSFTATAVNTTQISLSWIKAVNATHTIIEYNTKASWSLGQGIKIYNNTGQSYDHSNLQIDSTYYYQAWSYNSSNAVYSENYVSDTAGAYLYATGSNSFWKLDASNASFISSTENYGGLTRAVTSWGEYLYGGGETVQKTYQYWASNMTKKAESIEASGRVNVLVIDPYSTGEYIFEGNQVNVRKFWTSNMTLAGEYSSGGMGATNAIEIDDEFIYFHPTTNKEIHKVWKSNMTLSLQSSIGYDGTIFSALTSDEKYLYVTNSSSGKIDRIWKSNLTVKESSDDTHFGVSNMQAYGQYIYAHGGSGGGASGTMRKIYLSNLTTIDSWTYGTNVRYAFDIGSHYFYHAGAGDGRTPAVYYISNMTQKTVSNITSSTDVYTLFFSLPKDPPAEFADGDGSILNPYQITHIEHLYAVRNYLWANFTLMRDLNFSRDSSYMYPSNKAGNITGSGWLPLGTNTDKFTGSFNGQNYTISSLFINRSSSDYIGLFGYINSATVKNIGLPDVNINGGDSVGGLLGRADYSSISNCFTTGTVLAVATGLNSVGGLIGVLYASTLNLSYSSCNVTATHPVIHEGTAGGLIGIGHESSLINNSYATGDVQGHTRVGGFIGGFDSSSTIRNSYATGNILAVNRGGGFIGVMAGSAAIYNCYATGTVTRDSGSNTEFGGFAGRNNQCKILNSYSTGSVHYLGGADPANRGFCGSIAEGGVFEMSGNFWDTQTSKQTSTVGVATGKTTLEMNSLGTFTTAAWNISYSPVDLNNGYPYLSWQNNSDTTVWLIAKADTPQPPTSFTATTVDYQQINLTWTKGVNATHTLIEYNTTDTWNRGEGIQIYNDTGEHYNHTGLIPGTTYYYQAWSYNNATYLWNESYVSDSNTTEIDPSSFFMTLWNTSIIEGSETNNNQIKLPLESGGNYNFTVYWGDGTSNHIQAYDDSNVTHTYDSPGVYRVNISGDLVGWRFNNEGDKTKILDIEQWGTMKLGNSNGYFYGCKNLNITAVDSPDLSDTTTFLNMFYGCTTFNGKIGHWDTRTIENMGSVFRDCEIFNQDIGDWDTANVTNMIYMFRSASEFNQNISNWNTSKVNHMGAMFRDARKFNQLIGNWNTRSVSNMWHMFYGAIVFNQNISRWDTSNVQYMQAMFYNAHQFNQPIGTWNTSKVENMDELFRRALQFDQSLATWDTSKLTTMMHMFRESPFNQNINSWDTSNVVRMDNAFRDATHFNQPLDNWNTANVTNMFRMFMGATSFDQDLGVWDVSNLQEGSTDWGAGDMFQDVTLSTHNYDNLLIGWSTQDVNTGVYLHGGNSKYTGSPCAGGLARTLLESKGWTITDGGSIHCYHPPTIQTNPPTNITATTATLQGYLQIDGNETTTVRFEYGTNTSYGTNTTNQTKTSGEYFNETILDIIPGQLYWYRTYANNTQGSYHGEDQAFLTRPQLLTNFTANQYSETQINLTWTKAIGSNNTYIERNTIPTWNRGQGTLIYNDTGTQVEDSQLYPGVTYYYKAWGLSIWTYNPTLYQFSESSSNSSTETIYANKNIISKTTQAYSLEVNQNATILYGTIKNTTITAPITFEWHHVALTYDGSTMRLYMDGAIVNQTSLSGAIPTNPQPLQAGKFLTGELDEIRISTTARSPNWINTTYQNTVDPESFATFGPQQGVLSTWTYRKLITIDKEITSENLQNFPILIHTQTDTNLAENADTAGYDIIFMPTDEPWNQGTWKNKLDYEIETYNPTTGDLIVWVRIPTLSAVQDTELYMYYGNSLCVTNKQNPTGVWDEHYIMVHHLTESGDGSANEYRDSTSNARHGQGGAGNQSRVPTYTNQGKINGANVFDGRDDFILISDSMLNYSTFSAWIKTQSNEEGVIGAGFLGTSYYVLSVANGRLQIAGAGGEDERVRTSDSVISLDTWHHVVCVDTGEPYPDEFIIYVDGQQQSLQPEGTYRAAGKALIGARYYQGNYSIFFNGTLDEIRVSTIARSASWINASYQNQNNTAAFITIGPQRTKNTPPTLTNPTPQHQANTIDITPQLKITITDNDADQLDITFRTNASGSWQNIGTNNSVYNGTYTQYGSMMNQHHTTYYWSVNATDGQDWTNATYQFTTLAAETYYFNNYDTTNTTWEDIPNLIDGQTNTYAYTNQTDTIYHLNSTTFTSIPTEQIQKIQIRIYGYYENETQTASLYLQPIYNNTDGSEYHITLPANTAQWSDWIDITTGLNAPDTWDEEYLLNGNLSLKITSNIPEQSGEPTIYASKVELKILYLS